MQFPHKPSEWRAYFEELIDAVISSVCGDVTTGEKSYEEKMWMENGMGVYLVSL
ncbi:MAG: hypothetical protein KBI09_05890 [Mesotoga sp.]|nr:hypothetical protein [Mesotoga sp.]